MQILKEGHPDLSATAVDIAHGEDVTELAKEMHQTMIDNGGMGLAANQVGVLKRIIILKTPKFKGCVVNPVITRHVQNKIVSREGCLSFPGKLVDKQRYNKIVLEGFNEKWEPIKVDLNGISSFCAQHEIDHLNGITI
ncbi:peptide deformylase [Vibrio phage D81]